MFSILTSLDLSFKPGLASVAIHFESYSKVESRSKALFLLTSGVYSITGSSRRKTLSFFIPKLFSNSSAIVSFFSTDFVKEIFFYLDTYVFSIWVCLSDDSFGDTGEATFST